MHRRSNNRRAFSLIELLVVIAIIFLLIGILLGAMNAARKAARRAETRDMVLQIKTAWQGYLDEYRRFPETDIEQMDDTAIQILNAENVEENPKKIPFMDFRKVAETEGSGFLDPYGMLYQVRLDTDMNNKVTTPQDGEIGAAVAVWSLGRDQTEKTKDDLKSWER